MLLSQRGPLAQLPESPQNVVELDEWRRSKGLPPLGGPAEAYLSPYDSFAGAYRVGGDVSFVYDAGVSTLARDLFEQQEWQAILEQQGDASALFAGAPQNLKSRFATYTEAMDGLGVAGNLPAFREALGRQRQFNSQFASVRSVVSLGYEQYGWSASDAKIVAGAFSDLSSAQGDIAKWEAAAMSISQTEVVQRLWDFLKNKELWQQASDGLASLLGAAAKAVPWIGACITAGIKLPMAIRDFQEAKAKAEVARLDAIASIQLAGVPRADWSSGAQQQAVNVGDATREASVLNSVQIGDISSVLKAPRLGSTLRVTDLRVDNRQVGYAVSTVDPLDGLFGGTALVPGTQTLTSGAYVTATRRENTHDFGIGLCKETPVATSALLSGTLAATSAVATMVNSRTPTPMLFSVDTRSLAAGWEDFVRRQFELLFSFSSGWFCQSNVLTDSVGSLDLDVDPAWLCTAALAEGEEGFGSTASAFSSSYSPGVLNWPPVKCSVRTFAPHEPVNVSSQFVLPRGLISNDAATLADVWKGVPPKGPDRMGLPYAKAYGMVGYGVTANLYRYLVDLYFSTTADPWITKNFEGRPYSDLKSVSYITGAGRYGTVNPVFDGGQEFGQGPVGNEGTDERLLKAARPSPTPFGGETHMWRWFPTPESMDYSRSRPVKTLDNIRTRQMAAIALRHPIIFGVDPDAMVSTEGTQKRVFAAFDDPTLRNGWQAAVTEMLSTAAVIGIDLDDVANPQLRTEVAKRKAMAVMLPGGPPSVPELPAPRPNDLVSPAPQDAKPPSQGLSSAGKVAMAAALGALGVMAYRRYR